MSIMYRGQKFHRNESTRKEFYALCERVEKFIVSSGYEAVTKQDVESVKFFICQKGQTPDIMNPKQGQTLCLKIEKDGHRSVYLRILSFPRPKNHSSQIACFYVFSKPEQEQDLCKEIIDIADDFFNDSSSFEQRKQCRSYNRRNESVVVKSSGEFYAFCQKLDKILVNADMDVTITLEDIGIAEISILPISRNDDPLNFDLSIQDGGASLQLINCDNGEDTWFDGIRDNGTEKKVANEILAFVREIFNESRRLKDRRSRRRNESIRCDQDDSFYKMCSAVDREIQYGLRLESKTTVNHSGWAEICIYGDAYNRDDVCLKLDLDHDMNLTVFNDDVSWEHEFYDVQVSDIIGIVKKTVEDAWGIRLKV